MNMQLVTYIGFSTGNFVGQTKPFVEGQFSVTLTSKAGVTITSVLTGVVNQTIDGYSLLCVDEFDVDTALVLGDIKISIPGKLLVKKYFINISDKYVHYI